MCTDGFRNLHHHRAHTAGTAIYENRFARLQVCLQHQPDVRGDAHQRHSRRFLIADTFGRGVQPFGADACQFSSRSLPTVSSLVRAPHAVADGKFGDAFTDCLHRASQIAADDEGHGQLRRHHAAAHVSVDGIDR